MCRAAWVSRPPSQIGCILSLAASKSRTSPASSLRRSVSSGTVFSPLRGVPSHARSVPSAVVTVSAKSAANVLPAPPKINECRSVSARLHDQLVHPGRSHHVDRDAVGPGNQQKVTALSRFEIVDLRLGEVERLLQLGRLRMLLRAKHENAGVGGQHGPVFGVEKVAGILAHQDQTPAVLADAAGQSDQESSGPVMVEQEPGLVNEKVPGSTISPKCRPEPVGEQ